MKLDHKTLDEVLLQYEKGGCISHIGLMRRFQITYEAAKYLKEAVERIVELKKANASYLLMEKVE